MSLRKSPRVCRWGLFCKPIADHKVPKAVAGQSAACQGKLVLDDGAVRGVSDQGRSLLPIGVVSVSGIFSAVISSPALTAQVASARGAS
ncbi:MAG: hypothetical protein CM15mP74_18180 [Halieaceae bacterium]|nr:MAG: hypothetical protein CM15mP74_18180 [Halieaceae bacterium]